MGKYFSVTKKISIAASVQHAGVIADGNLLADWQAIEIPKGAACLKSLTLLARPKGNSTPTPNIFDCEIYFSKTNTFSLGTVGGAVSHFPLPDLQGLVKLDDGFFGANVTNGTAIGSTGLGNEEQASVPLILQGDPVSGDNVGFDTIYVGILSGGNWNFGNSNPSLNAVNEANFAAGTQTVITMDGSSMDVREHFAAGDILHAQDDAVLGTLASADSATQLTLTAANTDAIAEDDIIYNLHPITLVLGFEK